MSRGARGARGLVRVLVVADIAFYAQYLWVLVHAPYPGLTLFASILVVILWGLADLGAWDLERPALKARLLLGVVGIVLAFAMPRLRGHTNFDDLRRDPVFGIEWSIVFAALSAAWVVACTLALHATSPARRARDAAR